MFELLLSRPITWALILLQAYIFLTDPEQYIDCTKETAQQQFIHSFIHTQPAHFAINIWSLYSLGRLEEKYGSLIYLILIILLLILSSWIQTVLSQIPFWPFPACSVGFSAVLLGMTVMSRLSANNWQLDFNQIQRILVLLLVPVLKNPRVSLTGHLAGILAGLFLSFFVGINDLPL